MKMIVCLSVLYLAGSTFGQADELTLAEHGKSDYVIVTNDDVTELGKLAVAEFRTHFEKGTGVKLGVAKEGTKRIIIGLTDEVEEMLDEEILQDQEAIIRTNGNDLILVGGGKYGTIYAVYSFLERYLGVRWFSMHANGTLIPRHQKLVVANIDDKIAQVFQYRMERDNTFECSGNEIFFFRNRVNLREGRQRPDLSSLKLRGPQCHTLFSYIGPEKDYFPPVFDFDWESDEEENRVYFAEHSDYFSLNSQGKRNKRMQLCFSNPELRKELTRRLELQVNRHGDTGVFNISAQDWPGVFCHCDGCDALTKKYNCTGGPMFDYLIEVGNALKDKYPDVYVSTLAYRKGQSESPPEHVEKLPDNIVVIFAPVDDDVTKTLDHSNNRDTYRNLQKWTAMSHQVWVWYYVWYGGTAGIVDRVAKDIRLLQQAGVSGTFFQHVERPYGLHFSDLLTYMCLKQYQSPEGDPRAHMQEFCNFYYGEAAPEIIAWLDELEQHRKGLRKKLIVGASAFDWGYFTPENIVKTERMFEKLEARTLESPVIHGNIRTLRIGTDCALLENFPSVRMKYPDYAGKSKDVYQRVEENFYDTLARRRAGTRRGKPQYLKRDCKPFLNRLSDSMTIAELDPPPIPKEFADRGDRRFIRMIPKSGKIKREMKDAAYGFAYGRPVSEPEKKFPFGVYSFDDPKHPKRRSDVRLAKGDLKLDGFHFYSAGTVQLSGHCIVWATPSWYLNCHPGRYFDAADPEKEWDIYVSLKFVGPSYELPAEDGKDAVFMDQVILVEHK